MSDLRNVISQLASQFANGVLEAIRGASLEDILLETRTSGGALMRAPAAARSALPAAPGSPVAAKGVKKSGRLERRSEGDIAGVVERIVALLGQHAKGLRAEEIRARLGLDAKELPRPITQALADRKITKVGEKRATTYFAGAGKPVPPAAAKPAAPATPKPTAPSASKPTSKPKTRGPAPKKTPAPVAARSAPKTKGGPKGATKAAPPAAKANPKGKKAAKTSTKAPARGAGGHKLSPIEEAVTIVTTGAPGDISG